MQIDTLYAIVRDVAGKAPSADALAIAWALDGIAHAITRLGNADASTSMGGLEGLGAAIIEAGTLQADALNNVSSSIDALEASRAE